MNLSKGLNNKIGVLINTNKSLKKIWETNLMNKTARMTINEYKNYLIRSKFNTTQIYMNIKTIDDIKLYESSAKTNLEELEKLSIEYKLYDKNYDEFRIAMGKFAMAINKMDKLKIDIKYKAKFIDIFLNFNEIFEDLERKNIMKDVYVWKYI